MRDFHELTVADVRREAADAVSIAFAVPEAIRAAFAYEPGQHLTVMTEIGGEEVRRSYSICRAPCDNEIRVAVRKVEGGAFSAFANEALAPGARLRVMPPSGRFVLPKAAGPRHLVAFAAGSGITPILAMLRSVLLSGNETRFTLFYGNRSPASIMFREEIEDLKDRFLGRFRVFHILSRERDEDVPLLCGRLDGEKVTALASRLLDLQEVDNIFLCGPGSMIVEAREALKALGVDRKRIRAEYFAPVDGATGLPQHPPARRPAIAASAGAVAEIEVIRDGARLRFPFPEGAAGVIDAAQAAGITLPHSCKGGMCCTCRARVIEGDAEMVRNYSLEPWEIEQGFVLSCQTRPLSKRLVLDFDEV